MSDDIGPVARIVVRDNGGKADLVLGACTKRQCILQPGDVWELSEILSELVMRRIGKSHIRPTMHCEPGEPPRCACWGNGITNILNFTSNGYLTLTEAEWAELCRKDNE